MNERARHLILRSSLAKKKQESSGKVTIGDIAQSNATAMSPFESVRGEDLLQATLEPGIAIEPKRWKLMTEMQEVLQAKFPQVRDLTLIPFGSTINGGALLREALGNAETNSAKPSDLDWLIGFSGYESSASNSDAAVAGMIPSEVRQEILDAANAYISTTASDRGLPPSLRTEKNPDYSILNSNCCIQNLSSVDDAYAELQEYRHAIENGGDPTRAVNLLRSVQDRLLPSIPPTVNERNTYFLLSALHRLAQEDRAVWQSIVNDIDAEIAASLSISTKHMALPHDRTEKSVGLRKDVVRSQQGKRVESIHAQLMATGDSQPQKPATLA